MTRTAPEGSVSRVVLQSEAGPEDWQARMATMMPERGGIAMMRGILFAAFIVSLASRSPGASMPGREWVRSVYFWRDQAQRQGCHELHTGLVCGRRSKFDCQLLNLVDRRWPPHAVHRPRDPVNLTRCRSPLAPTRRGHIGRNFHRRPLFLPCPTAIPHGVKGEISVARALGRWIVVVPGLRTNAATGLHVFPPLIG